MEWLRAVGTRVMSTLMDTRSNVEVLHERWHTLLEEHGTLVSSEGLDDMELLRRSAIKEHLHAVVELILSEASTNTEGMTGPLTEYLLENELIKTICALAMADRPPGMLALCLYYINRLIKPNARQLLPHVSVHDSIHHLIAVCIELHELALATPPVAASKSPRAGSGAGADDGGGAPSSSTAILQKVQRMQRTQRMVVSLVSTIWWAIRDTPSLLTCFYDAPVLDSGPWRPSAITASGVSATAPTTSPHRPARTDRATRDLLLLKAVIPHLRSRDKTGTQARDAMLCAIALRDARITSYILRSTSLCSEIPMLLSSRFRLLPMDWDNATSAELLASARTKDFLVTLRFANAVAVTSVGSFPATAVAVPVPVPAPDDDDDDDDVLSPPPPVSSLCDVILEYVVSLFLDATLKPCLMHTSEGRARAATVYVHGMVADLSAGPVSSPILGLLLRFLVGDGDTFDDTVLSTLIRRLSALNRDLAQATAELLGELVGLNDPVVMDRLILAGLAPSAGALLASLTESDPATPSELAVGAIDTTLLSSLEGADHLESDPSFAAYLSDAQRQVVASAVGYETWGDVWWDANIGDDDLATTSGGSDDDGGGGGGGGDHPPHSPFLDALLRRLQCLFSQRPPQNLAVTGIITQLAMTSNPLVHAYLFPSPVTKAGTWLSLTDVIAELWEEAKRRSVKVPEFATAVKQARSMARASLDAPTNLRPSSVPFGSPSAQDRLAYTFSKERRHFIEAYVLLEEFLKELAAVAEAKSIVAVRYAMEREEDNDGDDDDDDDDDEEEGLEEVDADMEVGEETKTDGVVVEGGDVSPLLPAQMAVSGSAEAAVDGEGDGGGDDGGLKQPDPFVLGDSDSDGGLSVPEPDDDS